jgi:hypothetical protein
MHDLDQIQTIDDYFAAFGKHHVQKATELLRPLHVPAQDPVPDFSELNRQSSEPQAHVIAASIKMLNETRRAILAAACGTGKTLIRMLVIHRHSQRSARQADCNARYRAIVLCPDHFDQEVARRDGGDDTGRQSDAVQCRRQGGAST